MTFRKKIMLILILFAIIPTIIAGIISVSTAISMAEENTIKTLELLVNTNGSTLDTQIQLQREQVALTSQRYLPRIFLNETLRSNWKNDQNLDELMKEFLTDWVLFSDIYNDAIILDKNGIVVSGYSNFSLGIDLSEQDYFINSKTDGKSYISDSGISLKSKERVFSISHGVFSSDGEFLGVLVLFIRMDFFNSFLSDIKPGENSYSYLTDKNGIILYHPDSSLLGKVDQQPEIDMNIIEFASDKTAKTGSFIGQADGKEQMMFFYLLDDIEWALVLREPVKDFHSARFTLINTLVITVLVCIAIAIILGTYLSKYVTEPINRLNRTFGKAAIDGQYEKCTYKAKHEFGKLVNSYNSMVDTLDLYFEQTEFLAYNDTLTGIGNWSAITQRLSQLIEYNTECGVISFDIDDFKVINEFYGRDFGNILIIEISKRLSNPINCFDTVARTGGDEFCVITLGDVHEVEQKIELVLELIGEPIILNGIRIELTASLGVVALPCNSFQPNEIIKKVEMAMYTSKSAGKNRYNIYGPQMEMDVQRKNQISNVLKTCLEKNSVYLMYQPEIDPITHSTVAYEALMRVCDEKMGELWPDEFIPISEKTALIVEMGRWALNEACNFARRVIESNPDFRIISVNVSVVQLIETSFISNVKEALKNSGLQPQYLQLEITESALIINMNSAVQKLSELRSLGITIALDDFGTSFSSLNYLTSLPIDTLKIDKSFIDKICFDDKRKQVTETIISMSHDLGLTVVAEGVEDEEQLKLLISMGCDLIQGYYFSRPLKSDLALNFSLLRE